MMFTCGTIERSTVLQYMTGHCLISGHCFFLDVLQHARAPPDGSRAAGVKVLRHRGTGTSAQWSRSCLDPASFIAPRKAVGWGPETS